MISALSDAFLRQSQWGMIATVIWQLLTVGILGLMGTWVLLTRCSRQPTPLKMGKEQLRRDFLRQDEVKTWVGEHPPQQLTGLFLAPVLITSTAILYSLTFMLLTATCYWGGPIFRLSLLIPVLATLLIGSCIFIFLVTWLRDRMRLQWALWEALQASWGDLLAGTLAAMSLLLPLLGFGWFPLQDFWGWIQRPEQAAGLMIGLSLVLSGKLLEKFEGDSLRYRIQHQAFCCDRHHTALTLLQPQQLASLLTAEQQTALATEDAKICGWHCPACHETINRESVHLQIARISRPSQSSHSKAGRGRRSRTSSAASSSSTSTYAPTYYPETLSSSSDLGSDGRDGSGDGNN
jgi:hypothetical protein